MPGFDGTGPQGRGPMTGRGMGFCILQESKDKRGRVEGLAGIQGTPVSNDSNSLTNRKEVTTMPRGDGTGPLGSGPMTGRVAGLCAGYPVPGYMNPAAGKAGFYGPVMPIVGPYRTAYYGYGVSYGRGFNSWFGRGFGFGRDFGRGRGRGRGRFRFCW